jgi:RHS repeat-associated protein
VGYIYEHTTSRLKRVVDGQGRVSEYQYNLDNTTSEVSFPGAPITTPSVAYTYDPFYNRKSSMVDGIGTTTYVYKDITVPPSLGASRLSSVDGPLPDDTISYEYDELGRVVSRSINNVSSKTTFDVLGRRVALVNPLGAFSYAYDDASVRVSSFSYPNGINAAYTYFDKFGDQRLKQMSYVRGITAISQFGYAYNPVGSIISWSQQIDAAPPKVYNLSYDAVDQLKSAALTDGPTTLKSYLYTYDFACNRTAEQIDGVTRQASYNALNELTNTSSGPQPVTYEWDSLDRLVAIVDGTKRSEFSYDGLNRRVRIVEKENGSTTSERRLLWCEDETCEERDGSGGTVLKQYFDQGMKILTGSNMGDYYYTRDNLGSVREMIDSSGTIRARYNYDPHGRQTKLNGDLDCDFGFARLTTERGSGLFNAVYRYYDPETGRWLNRDPLPNAELSEGPNLFAYVQNNPINKTDRLGLVAFEPRSWGPMGPIPCPPSPIDVKQGACKTCVSNCRSWNFILCMWKANNLREISHL